jgi:hypothetical protein
MRSSASFQSVMRSSPSSTDIPLVEELDHLAAPVRLLEAVHVVGVDPVRAEHRGRDDRREVPQAAIDDFAEDHRGGGAEHVERQSGQRTLQPRAIDLGSRDERRQHARDDADGELIRDDGRRDRHRHPRPDEGSRNRRAVH